MNNELRFQALVKMNPEHAAVLAKRAQEAVTARFTGYQHLATASETKPAAAPVAPAATPAPTPKPNA